MNLITSKTKSKIDVVKTVNQAIGYVQSNPCCICSCEDFCNIRYKGTCKVWLKLKIQLLALREIKE